MNKVMKTFFPAFTAGVILGLFYSPFGKKLRDILLENKEEDAWPDRDTFNVNELVSRDSISFEALKEKIAANKS
ncbi:MAG: hypothetical protein IPO83_07465 [Chitinophagaceae bacterium]|nr:hypothetical protein [Chitinophagaceae bacterium]